MLSRCRALNPLRLSSCKIGLNPWFRSYHNAIAKFTTIDPKGVPVSYKIGIKIGEPNESYVYVEPEVGNAIKSAIIRQLGSDRSDYRETLPLQFNHNSRHFSHSKCYSEFNNLYRSVLIYNRVCIASSY